MLRARVEPAWLLRPHLVRTVSTAAPRSAPAAALASPRPDPLAAAPDPRTRAQTRIRERDRTSPPPSVSPALTDSYGRKHDYLRISLTEKCNLRCTYCMPEAGVPLLPPDHLLTTDEVERTARLFVQHGVRKIRLTGGEPTIRKDIVDVVERLGRLSLDSLGMTSNGLALPRKLPALVRAGLTHLNLSLDTLDPLKYELMTRRRGFERVMHCLELAQDLKREGLRTKLNVVVIRGLNDMEVPQFVELTRDRDITIRFIEYMPFEDNRWSTQKLVPSASLLSTLSSLHPPGAITKLADSASDTTRAYRVEGYRGSFGFISSMTDHFCGTCSRLRVGADGGVKVCLFGPPVLSLRALLRSPTTSDAELMASVGRAVWGKHYAHNGLGAPRQRRHASASAQRAFAAPHARTSARRGGATSRLPVHLLSANLPPSFARAFSTSRPSAFSSSARALRRTSDDDDDKAPAHLTHIDPSTGKASMVSVSSKPSTVRTAVAQGEIYLGARAFSLIDLDNSGDEGGGGGGGTGRATLATKKGDVLSIAELAGLMGAKHTALLIPLCHPLSLSHVRVSLRPLPGRDALRIECEAQCVGPTGVEMEALTGVSVAALTVWDMCKAVAGQEMRIEDVRVVSKSGGRSGDWVREEGEAGRSSGE